MRVATAEQLAATADLPAHCHVVGAIDERTGTVDGKPYAIKFRLRMPEAWNGRFFMQGGGGSNGTLATGVGTIGGQQTTTALSQGYAVVVTDSGHDNAVNNDPNAGGVSSFGMDPQARIDFGYNAYDVATRAGKAIVEQFYGRAPERSYFVGCSEGGREAMVMSQRFPTHYDGIVAGAPALRLPWSASYAPHLMQTFGALAVAQGNVDPNGIPLINRTYTDADLQLISQAVLGACDALDGVVDGMAQNMAACTDAAVMAKLNAIACTGAKTDACLTRGQIDAMQAAIAGPRTSAGVQIVESSPWDPGIAGMNGTAFNSGFRSWWLGSYASPTNNAVKVTLSTPQHALVWRNPPFPLTASQYVPYEMQFDIDQTEALVTSTTNVYMEAPASFGRADNPDLSGFQRRGGKMIVYHGGADAALSINDTIKWYREVDQRFGGNAESFVRLFPVPGMTHCSGGPGTDRFDMLTPLVAWVEQGVAPDTIAASASAPGYFGVSSRTRPLCPYPTYARYNGTGDVNLASSFSCVAP